MEISDWRKQIDLIEDDLIRLLNKRAEAAIAIGHLKRLQDLPILDSNREKEILNRVRDKNPGPLPQEALSRIFSIIIEETRKTEAQKSNGNHS